MNPLVRITIIGAVFLGAGIADVQGDPLLTETPGPDEFVLVRPEGAAPICVDRGENSAVRRAAGDLLQDIARVTGQSPAMVAVPQSGGRNVVVIGVLGSSPFIDGLAALGKIDVRGVAGAWEAAVVQTVLNPSPGIDKALVIAGSDRRGAIYGIYWLSESIGVSPWYWWADVPTQRRTVLAIAAGAHRLNPPKVKYRGIFLNDEDWGLRVWASKTFDPQIGNIGPKTYARIFELVLRLRGNVLWPAMHPGTRAFNFYAEDKALADEYGVVMGSSHAEPMLRDNVDEWGRDGVGEYDYTTNAANVLRYWEERVEANRRFENIYTIGMRGIHDGPMEGGGTLHERADRLRRIIANQRDLLRRHVNPEIEQVPQLFCPYKEVLPIYEMAPEIVPDDVTLLWPDDDYGYIQHFSDEAERRRKGGAGVYYHVSYWGRPYDYLWLCSTPPALIGEEMTKAFRFGARRIWIVNVGDIKPAEWDIEFFLRLAWDPDSWDPAAGQHAFFRRLAQRDFGDSYAEEIAALLDEYYRLNFQRRPEHVGRDVGVSLLAHPVFSVDTDGDEAQRRLDSFAALRRRADRLGKKIDREHADAYFELVLYPVRSAQLMNQKWLSLDKYESYVRQGRAAAADCLDVVARAQTAIEAETEGYNDRTAGGKWRGMMSDAPRDLAVFGLPSRVPPSPHQEAVLGVAVEDSMISYRGDLPNGKPAHLALPAYVSSVAGQHFVDIFGVGQKAFDWNIKASGDWIRLSSISGTGDRRVFVSIDRRSAPLGDCIKGNIHIAGAGRSVDVTVAVSNGPDQTPDGAPDFAEADGRLVIDAAHPSAQTPGSGLTWEAIQGLGYDGVAMGANSGNSITSGSAGGLGNSGELDYRLWIDTPGEWRLVTRSLPTWPVVSGHKRRFAVAFDAEPPQIVELPLYHDENDPKWQEDVLRNASFASLSVHLLRGPHRLRITTVDPGIVIDAFLLERPGADASGYLWPMETKATVP